MQSVNTSSRNINKTVEYVTLEAIAVMATSKGPIGLKKGQKAPKRTISDVSDLSNTSLDESHIMKKLEDIERNMAKKTDLEKSEETMTKYLKDMEQRYKDEMSVLNSRVEGLVAANSALKNDIKTKDAQINELKSKVTDLEILAKNAQSKANYNEQYSRKNNIKIHGVKEEPHENTQEVTTNLLRDVAGVTVSEDDIIAVHRIPGKKDSTRPILLKVKNSSVKTKVMQNRPKVKSTGKYKLSDDVTALNSSLITRLLAHPKIEQAWFFNGSVYGLVKTSQAVSQADDQENQGRTKNRVKFDIHDDLNEKLSKY